MVKNHLSKYYKQINKLYDNGIHPCGYARDVSYHKDRGFGGLCILLNGGGCRTPHKEFTTTADLDCKVYQNYFFGGKDDKKTG